MKIVGLIPAIFVLRIHKILLLTNSKFLDESQKRAYNKYPEKDRKECMTYGRKEKSVAGRSGTCDRSNY